LISKCPLRVRNLILIGAAWLANHSYWLPTVELEERRRFLAGLLTRAAVICFLFLLLCLEPRNLVHVLPVLDLLQPLLCVCDCHLSSIQVTSALQVTLRRPNQSADFVLLRKTPRFVEFSLCLSRACLGKMIILYKKRRFSHLLAQSLTILVTNAAAWISLTEGFQGTEDLASTQLDMARVLPCLASSVTVETVHTHKVLRSPGTRNIIRQATFSSS
jgi:hypothetical protein